MLFYFSATGNDKYIAERISAVTGETPVSIGACVKAGAYRFALRAGEDLGFVTPTYFWGLPSIVTDFLAKTELKTSGPHYVYHILTYGSFTGSAHRDMAKALAVKGLALQGRFIVRMVDTWTPLFDCSDERKNIRDTAAAEPAIAQVLARIAAKEAGDFNRRKGPRLISVFAHREYERKRATRHFRVKESCVGCGLCARQCPLEAIRLQNGKPVWVKEKCALCLGCLHRCPAFAIQYGKRTEGRGQFVNPNTKL